MRDSRRLRLVLALLLLTSFTLLTIDSRAGDGGAFGAVRGVLSGVLDPVGRAARTVTAPIGRGASAAWDSGRDQRRIEALEREKADLQRQLAANAQAAADRAALEHLGYAGFRGDFDFKLASVTARGAPFGDAEQTITIDIGSDDGIVADMRVVSTSGDLVGRVRRVQARSSLVVLATDRTSTTPVRLDVPGARVSLSTVTGQGPGQPLQLLFGDTTTTLTVGAALTTVDSSVAGVPLPAGIRVGTIATIEGNDGLTQTATVTPAADLEGLATVGVAVGSGGRPPRPVVPKVTTSPPAPSPPPPSPPPPSPPPPNPSVPAGG